MKGEKILKPKKVSILYLELLYLVSKDYKDYQWDNVNCKDSKNRAREQTNKQNNV